MVRGGAVDAVELVDQQLRGAEHVHYCNRYNKIKHYYRLITLTSIKKGENSLTGTKM